MRCDEDSSMGKIRTSVQSMIAEARKVVKPAERSPPSYNSSNSHIELHLPTARITEHLKEILHLCPDSYRKIDRHRRISMAKAEQSREELLDRSPFCPSRPEDTILLSRLTDRYQLKGILNYESELIDHKFHQLTKKNKRPLCKKNTINLQPIGHELPAIRIKSDSMTKVDEGLVEKIRNVGSKYFLSLTEEQIARAREERAERLFKTVDQPETKQLQRYILSPNTKLKPDEDRIQRRKPRKSLISQPRAKATTSVQLIEEEEGCSPWPLELGDSQLIF